MTAQDIPQVLVYRGGPDRRMRTRTPRLLGNFGSASLEYSLATAWIFFATDPFWSEPIPGSDLFLWPIACDDTNCPLTTDTGGYDQSQGFMQFNDCTGEAFPSGTYRVCTSISLSSSFPRRVAFGTSTPSTVLEGYPNTPNRFRKQWWVFVAYGIPGGASGTIEISKQTSGTVLSTISVSGANGSTQVIPMPAFDGYGEPTWTVDPFTGVGGSSGPPDSIQYVATWSGGVPAAQHLIEHPFAGAYFVVVPDTLPGDYTSRAGIEQFTQSLSLGKRDYEPGRRLRSKSYFTPANANLSQDPKGTWISDTLQSVGLVPRALNETVDSSGSLTTQDFFIPFPPPGHTIPFTYSDLVITGPGWRKVKFLARWSSGLPGGGGASWGVVITRSDTGGTYSSSFTEADVQAGVNWDLGSILPASLGTVITLTAHFTPPSPYYPGMSVAWQLVGHPRCDIPLPYHVPGPTGIIAPGGYLASSLADATDLAPLVRLAAGVTTTTAGYDGYTAFLPSADGWYEVDVSGFPTGPISTNEFAMNTTTDSGRVAERALANQPLYVGLGSGNTGTLQSFSPSFSAIASGGTSLAAQAQGGWWQYGTISLPAPGTYRITITLDDLPCIVQGLVFEWSTTDTEVVTVDGRAVWESWYALANNAAAASAVWESRTSTPPGSPTDKHVYIVGTGATGVWDGHDDDLAYWNGVLGVWQYLTPESDMWIGTHADGYFFDGAWHAFSAPVITRNITVDAATTVYCVFSPYSVEYASGTPNFTTAWTAI